MDTGCWMQNEEIFFYAVWMVVGAMDWLWLAVPSSLSELSEVHPKRLNEVKWLAL